MASLISMDEKFIQHLYKRQHIVEAIPSNNMIADWAFNLLDLIYPERITSSCYTLSEIRDRFLLLERELIRLINVTRKYRSCDTQTIVKHFFENIPRLYRIMNTDVEAVLNGDPASISTFEIIRTYPGFLATSFYRIAHALLKLKVPLIPRILTEYAHSLTGIDIHPGAEIGEYLCIDHGTGIVIGETTIVGNHVKIYQRVTLGALSVEKFMANTKRHPNIEDHVTIYAGATILGGDTTIGKGCIIGGNVWLTKSVPSGSRVYHRPTIKVIESNRRMS